jgi:hypothetical protein
LPKKTHCQNSPHVARAKDFTHVVIPGRNHMEACRDPLFGDALVRFITANNPQ